MPDDSPDGIESSFRVQFTRFAEEIRQLVTAVFGGELDVVATHLARRSRIFAEVPLTVGGENLARLKIDFWCCLDSYQQFLAVEESTYQLIAQVDRAPIIRFEYERGATSKPRAHVQVHAHRGALSHLLSQARHPRRTAWSRCTYPSAATASGPASKTSSSSSWSSAGSTARKAGGPSWIRHRPGRY
ncbi:MAG: hypothetical protein ACRDSR_22155 [Pseudonocardiaceae bacterium]